MPRKSIEEILGNVINEMTRTPSEAETNGFRVFFVDSEADSDSIADAVERAFRSAEADEPCGCDYCQGANSLDDDTPEIDATFTGGVLGGMLNIIRDREIENILRQFGMMEDRTEDSEPMEDAIARFFGRAYPSVNIVEEEPDDEDEDEDYEILPEWAQGRADPERLEVMALLPTKDGRRIGNATVFGIEMCTRTGNALIHVITDAQNIFTLSYAEVRDLFYPPEFIASDYPGNHDGAVSDTIYGWYEDRLDC